MALLNEQMTALRTQLGQLQALLDDSEARDADAQVQIETLGCRPQRRPRARSAAEERSARAELEEAERRRLEEEARGSPRRPDLENLPVGILRPDAPRSSATARACRSSATGSCSPPRCCSRPAAPICRPAGQAQIARVAAILREVADEIPPEIDWVIRVDGHTDKTQLGAGGDLCRQLGTQPGAGAVGGAAT